MGGGRGLGVDFCACLSSLFSVVLGKKTTQEHLFTSHRSACEVWVDSGILENFSRNGTFVIVARSRQSITNTLVYNMPTVTCVRDVVKYAWPGLEHLPWVSVFPSMLKKMCEFPVSLWWWHNYSVYMYRMWSRYQRNWFVAGYCICGQRLLHLWPVITFVANCYYICDQLLHLWPTVITFVASYYIYGQVLLHLWPVITFMAVYYICGLYRVHFLSIETLGLGRLSFLSGSRCKHMFSRLGPAPVLLKHTISNIASSLEQGILTTLSGTGCSKFATL